MAVCISVVKQAPTARASQTTAQANCILQRRTMLETPLAVASMAPTMATMRCRSARPLKPRAMSTTKRTVPITLQMADMTRPTVVPGWPRVTREAKTLVTMAAAIMVTGQAIPVLPHVDQAMAT